MALLTTYRFTIFLGATLLFLVQPMFARMVLPLLGGSPAVWNTCMLFFQAVLLAGYAYAHATVHWLGPRRQAVLHVIVLAVVLLLPPIAVPDGWSPPGDGTPIFWLLGLLTVSVGGPFFALSSTSPLLQKWFADCEHSQSKDPYFLYAASNAGSMLALISYPFLIERFWRLDQQSTSWRIGYAVFAVLMLGCAAQMWRSTSAKATGSQSPAASPVSWQRRLRWTALALVPSSWMLSVTTFLTTDLTPMPLLWIIPLAIYLLTFILAFAAKPPIPHAWITRIFPWTVLLLAASLMFQNVWQVMFLHLFAFFVGAMVCHGELAADRPETGRLTEFYLWLSVGGFLGGLFNGMIAPILFRWVLEYPLTIALACWLQRPLPAPDDDASAASDRRWLLGLLAAFAAAVGLLSQSMNFEGTVVLALTVLVGGGAALAFCCLNRPRWFAVAIAVVMLVEKFEPPFAGETLHVDRGYFGVHRVVFSHGRIYRLVHGVTVHGIQNRDPERPEMRRQPMAYYHRSGPLGQIFKQLRATSQLKQVAVVGLGAGAAACYCQDDQHFTFYEIDPIVKHIAETPEYFTHLSDLGQEHYSVVLGDGRLKLEQTDQLYDLIVFDAFSSDAIPMHLLTREAFSIYLEKLSEHGVLAFHISNMHLDLAPVLADLAADAGLVCSVCEDVLVTDEESRRGKTPSTWVAVARKTKDFAGLDQQPGWKPPTRSKSGIPWSDDFSNVLDTLK